MKTISRTVLSNARENEVYIPNAVICRKNISDNTKLIFGIIFSEALSKIENLDEHTISKMTKTIRNHCAEVPLGSIERECLCGTEAAKKIQYEIATLTATLDIAACFYECELHFARIEKPVCRLCENGKMFFRTIDLVNTLIDRELHNDGFENSFTENELETLEIYNRYHSPELLDEVIDILKR